MVKDLVGWFLIGVGWGTAQWVGGIIGARHRAYRERRAAERDYDPYGV